MYVVASTGYTGDYEVASGSIQEFHIYPSAPAHDRVCRLLSVFAYLYGEGLEGATTGNIVWLVGNAISGTTERLQVAQATFDSTAEYVAGSGPGIVGSRPTSPGVDETLTYPKEEGTFAEALRNIHFSNSHPLWLRVSNGSDVDFDGQIVVKALYVVLDR